MRRRGDWNARVENDPSSQPGFRNTFTDCMDDADAIGARNRGKCPIQTREPSPDPEIQLIQSRGLGSHHHRPGSDLGVRSVRIQPDVGCNGNALSLYFYGFHANSLVGSSVRGPTALSRSDGTFG